MAGRGIGGWARKLANQPRVLLAVKTALAASVAWLLAPLIPFLDSHYSYYAPMGAVISMYPTLVRSVRTGLQALIGLAVGAAVAFGVLALPAPRVVGVAVAVGVGVLLAGWRLLGEGRNWVPMTALFVLLIGGGQADNYSVNYLFHVVLGVIVGALVNLLVIPPLYLRNAEERLNHLRDRAAQFLRDLADALDEHETDEPEWTTDVAGLEETARNVRDAVAQADESRRGNPRGRRAGGQVNQDYERMRALEHTLFYVRDLTDLLAGFYSRGEDEPALSERVPAQLPAAIRAVADLIGAPLHGEDAPALLQSAEEALVALSRSLDEQAAGRPSSVAVGMAASVSLSSIVEVSRPFAA